MQSDEVRAFKNELSNYDFYRKRVEALNELIEICYHTLSGLHSPDFQNIPVHSPADLEKRDRLYAKIDKHRANIEKATRKMDEIDEVLNKMPRKIRIAAYRVYVQKETIEKVARENHYSKKGMWYWINKEIQKALK